MIKTALRVSALEQVRLPALAARPPFRPQAEVAVALKRAGLPVYCSAIVCSKAKRFYGWEPEHTWRDLQV